ncbi:MAG TPA: GNAT family N-acetyltransferase [Rudaea sp.]|nr:GNAT family N-acetyltransferase [Rudaea sp.]
MAELVARFHPRLEEIDAGAWNALLPDDNPFLDHAFLSGLEIHGCLSTRYGWQPYHLGLYDNGKLVAAAPLYVKTNSHGEYVFDWSWASAYERHGLDYYPKLLCAVPYSPVTGPRLLARAGDEALRAALRDTIRDAAENAQWSSAHLNFAAPADAAIFAGRREWLPRFDWQYHWRNRGWRDFGDFLEALTSKKRKNIRQERAHVARSGISCEVLHGDEIGETDWRLLHGFYRRTFMEKGNHAALTFAFFRHLGLAMPRRVLGVFARHGNRTVAAALLLRSRDTLYGRYWGASEDVPGLHFEVCYYQGIDYCLRNGMSVFEPGAQGEHKLARGFLPTRTDSFHFIADERFRAAIADALANEAHVLETYRAELMQHSPYASAS